MPNAYISVHEIKAAAPDSIRAQVNKYDAILLRVAGEVSRWIDNFCNRAFYPSLQTRVFQGSGGRELWIPDLISFTTISVSDDYGATYTALVNGTDFVPTVAGDENSPKSYSKLVVHPSSTLISYWPRSFRGVKVTGGVWGYTDDRAACWETTGDTVEDNPLTAGAELVTVNNVDGPDRSGLIVPPGLPRFQSGALYRIESEYAESTLAIDPNVNTVGLLRGQNGTTAVQHAQNTAIDVWRPPEPVRQAAAIQSFHQLMRGFQGYGDARAQPDLGQLFWFKALDPEAQSKLGAYILETVP